MSKRDVILFLFKWKYSLVGYFLFIVAVVTVLAYSLPQKYSATALVLVESNRAPVMRSDMAYGMDTMSVLNTEVAIIKSKTVLSSAIESVGVEARTESVKKSENLFGALFAWLIKVRLIEPKEPHEMVIDKLEKNLKVAPLPASNIIAISLGDKNPKWLAKIINEVTDSYIQHHLKIYSSPGSAEVYRRQSDRLGRILKSRRKELESYKRETNVSAIQDSMSALVRVQTTLNTELSDAHQELAEIQTLFAHGHAKVLLVQDRIKSIKSSLIETQEKLQDLELHAAKIQEAEVDILSTEKSFLDYQKRYEEAKLDDLANPEVVNVRVVEYAAVPTRPNNSRLFYILLAIVGGMILSLVIAFIREYFDHRVSDPDTIEELLGVPVLGSIKKV